MLIRAQVVRMDDNVNTDVLHPSQFFSLDDGKIRSGFLQAAAGYEHLGRDDLSGRIIIAGDNFGCGSSRETGARVFVLAGIRAVVARSLGHIFSRNLRNLGLLALECPLLPRPIPACSELEIDLENWIMSLLPSGSSLPVTQHDPFWDAVYHAGGLIPFLGITNG